MEKILTISDRLSQFIDYLCISERKFSQNVGLSNGLLGAVKKGGSFGIDKLEKILVVYPELNTNWLIFGKGEMILENVRQGVRLEVRPDGNPEEISLVNEPPMQYGKANEVERLKREVERLKTENAAYLKAFEAIGKASKAVEPTSRNVA